MPKYMVDGKEFDFHSELYESLDDTNNNNNNNNNNETDINRCLITDEILIENYITLSCNHKFNYLAIFNDIVNHKKKFNHLESNIVKTNEIRCPYCRTRHQELLPYYDMPGVTQIHGVNFIDETKKSHSNANYSSSNYEKCCYKTVVDETEIKCYLSCYHSQPLEDGKFYCYRHKRLMIKQFAKEKLAKQKEESKIAKLEAKQKAKAAKTELKQKEKEAKIEAKQKEKESTLKTKKSTKVINVNENVVIGEINIVSDGCVQILKTGIKKGTHCGCKIHNEDFNLCLRHYNLMNKN